MSTYMNLKTYFTTFPMPFTYSTALNLFKNRHNNGLDVVMARIGGRIIVDTEAMHTWLKQQWRTPCR